MVGAIASDPVANPHFVLSLYTGWQLDNATVLDLALTVMAFFRSFNPIQTLTHLIPEQSQRIRNWLVPAEHRVGLYENRIIFIVGVLLALAIRWSLREYQTMDSATFMDYYQFIIQNGRFASFKSDLSHYTPSYLYLLTLVSYFNPIIPKELAVKVVPVVFDFVCAFFAYKIVSLKYPRSFISMLSFLAILFAPTMIFNGSFWGQHDAVYTSFLMACVYYLCIQRSHIALFWFGLAFATKLQALFMSPLLLILFLRGAIPFLQFFLVPLVYLISVWPAWFAGKPLSELFTSYFIQAGDQSTLTSNGPTLYQWIPNQFYNFFYPSGLVIAVISVYLLSMFVYRSRIRIYPESIIYLALLSLLVFTFFLPKMHERYFFPADMISIVFAFYFPRYFYIPIVIGFVSFFSYIPYLFNGNIVIPFPYLSLILAGVIVWLSIQLFRELQTQGSEPKPLSPSPEPIESGL